MQRLSLSIILLISPIFACASEVAGKKPGPLMSDPVGISQFVQMIFGLLIVVGAILAIAWLIKRMGYVQTRASGVLKVLGGISLGQRERAVILQVGAKQLLVGIAPGSIRTLYVLDEPIEETVTTAIEENGFAQKLQSILKGRHS